MANNNNSQINAPVFGSSRAGVVNRSTRALSVGARSSRNLTNISKRASTVFSRLSSRFLFSPPDMDAPKPARIEPQPYFTGPPPKEETVYDEVVYARVIKPPPDGSVPRPIKMRGRLVLGAGRVHCDFKLAKDAPQGVTASEAKFTFDIGMIKDIKYKRSSSRDFFISFLHNDVVLNIISKKPEDARRWLIALFAEVRAQATVFNRILQKTINPTWRTVLKIGLWDGIQIDTSAGKISTKEARKLVMDDGPMDLAELCLREEVDLWTLCRGPDHPDTCEAMERLGTWLKWTIRPDESKYFLEMAEKGKENYSHRRKNDMLSAENTELKITDTALEEIKNPPGMMSMDQVVVQKEQNSKVNYFKRMDQVTEAYGRHKNGTFVFDESDPFEVLFAVKQDEHSQFVNPSTYQDKPSTPPGLNANIF